MANADNSIYRKLIKFIIVLKYIYKLIIMRKIMLNVNNILALSTHKIEIKIM